jgi:hypothetical protein
LEEALLPHLSLVHPHDPPTGAITGHHF